MRKSSYELHTHPDPNLPFIFHFDTVRKEGTDFPPHWHENLEILCFMKGTAEITMNQNRVAASEGQLAIINSRNIHRIAALSDLTQYYCLIIDKNFCRQFDMDIEGLVFQSIISDREAFEKFHNVVKELEGNAHYQRPAVKASILGLLVHLCRNHASTEKESSPISQESAVRKAISFIQENSGRLITLEELSRTAGFSKYYFCRLFKTMTGYSVFSYINIVRCKNAEALLLSQSCNVGSAALQCGFDNLSYFTRTYKKYIGKLPSETEQR